MTYDGVQVIADGARLGAWLEVPSAARGLVLFAHGTIRHSPRCRRIARMLQARGFATLLVDLLTPDEARVAAADEGAAFDLEFLAARLTSVTDWARTDARTAGLMPSYFGAGTAAAISLIAAARGSDEIGALVLRGGRLDLAASFLPRVRAPTLLVVGEADRSLLALSQGLLDLIPAAHRLVVVPGATHYFAERGALDEVGQLATAWIAVHAGSSPGRATGVDAMPAPTIGNHHEETMTIESPASPPSAQHDLHGLVACGDWACAHGLSADLAEAAHLLGLCVAPPELFELLEIERLARIDMAMASARWQAVMPEVRGKLFGTDAAAWL